jgi:hypothetical protein
MADEYFLLAGIACLTLVWLWIIFYARRLLALYWCGISECLVYKKGGRAEWITFVARSNWHGAKRITLAGNWFFFSRSSTCKYPAEQFVVVSLRRVCSHAAVSESNTISSLFSRVELTSSLGNALQISYIRVLRGASLPIRRYQLSFLSTNRLIQSFRDAFEEKHSIMFPRKRQACVQVQKNAQLILTTKLSRPIKASYNTSTCRRRANRVRMVIQFSKTEQRER